MKISNRNYKLKIMRSSSSVCGCYDHGRIKISDTTTTDDESVVVVVEEAPRLSFMGFSSAGGRRLNAGLISSNEVPSGMKTPPLHVPGSIPFAWEEVPGKPIMISSSLISGDPPVCSPLYDSVDSSSPEVSRRAEQYVISADSFGEGVLIPEVEQGLTGEEVAAMEVDENTEGIRKRSSSTSRRRRLRHLSFALTHFMSGVQGGVKRISKLRMWKPTPQAEAATTAKKTKDREPDHVLTHMHGNNKISAHHEY